MTKDEAIKLVEAIMDLVDRDQRYNSRIGERERYFDSYDYLVKLFQKIEMKGA